MNKKILILIIVVVTVIVGTLFLGLSLFSKKSGDVWVSSEKLINRGDIGQPGKILEIIFDYDKNTNPKLAIRKMAIKNGFPPVDQNQNKEYTLKMYDAGGSIIKSLPFGLPAEGADIPVNPLLKEKVSFIVVSDWFASAVKLEVVDVGGATIISKNLESVPTIDNKPNFKTINQNTLDGFQPLSFFKNTLFSIPMALAAGDGKLDIVFIGENFPSESVMESQINTYKTKLESIEPFHSRKSQIRYSIPKDENGNPIFNGEHCVMNSGEAFPSCDFVAIKQAIDDASVPVDKIIVLINNSDGSFDEALFTGFAIPESECCMAVINPSPADPNPLVSPVVFVHELGHLLGGLADEYEISAQNPMNSGNCYEGIPPNSLWNDLVAPNDYWKRCSKPNWYRSYEISIMDNTYTATYFNTPSQEIIETKLDQFTGINSFKNSNAPTASITSPASGANLSGVVIVQTALSDDLGIARANLYVNGTLYSTAYQAPFSFSLNTTEFNNGSYTLEVKAIDVPGNTKSATVKVNITNSDTGDDGLKVTVKEGTDEGKSKIYLVAGEYTVTEDELSNWDFDSAICISNSGSQTGFTATNGRSGVIVESGKTTVCTFENAFNDKGSIKVIKKSIGGNDTFSFDSNFGVASLTTTEVNKGTASQTIPNLAEGSNYYISETSLLDGWELSSVKCDNGGKETIDRFGLEDIIVSAGETTTCTFTNTYNICAAAGGAKSGVVPFY